MPYPGLPEHLTPKLTPEQCQACQRALRTLIEMEPLYALAEKCGVDTTGYKSTNGELRKRLEVINEFLVPHG